MSQKAINWTRWNDLSRACTDCDYYLKWPLLEIEASGLGVPLRAASCCSRAFDSKYSSQAAASCNRFKSMSLRNKDYWLYVYHQRAYARLPVSLDHQTQVWPAVSGGWFVHAEHLESMLPSKKEQWLLHDSWQPSEQVK